MSNPHIHVPYEKIGDYLSFILQHKLDLEIYFSSSALDSIAPDSILKLRDTLAYGPSLSFHGPFMDLSPGAVDSKVRKATLERFNHVLEIADILRPECIVLHSGYEKWKYALNIGLWLEKSIETWGPINEKAKGLGTKIAIENIFEDEPDNLKSLMDAMDSDNFGICFDAGHCNLFSQKTMELWLQELKSYIIELHLHDNDKSSDQHLPIGDGNIDFNTLFSELKGKDCIYTIEAHSPESVLKSMERLKGYLPVQ